jgi:hypothetical protein
MKYRIILALSLMILFIENTNAQNNLGKSDDAARINLNIFIPKQAEAIPEIASSLLKDKISQMVTPYALTGSDAKARFVIVPVLSVLGKEVTATAPAMTVLSIQLSLYIGDGFEGIKFSTTSFTSKGVGANETKAYIDAIKKININNPSIKGFIDNGKTKIVEYYNSICDFNLKKANTLATQNNFEEAIYMLMSVPEVAKTCYDKSMDAVAPIFKQMIDLRCSQSLMTAKSIWSAGQNSESASSIASILSNINPNASCFPEVIKFSNLVSKRILEIDKREWNFKLKQQQDETDIRKATIKAARDIGVAYGNNQPDIIYNTTLISTWW